MATSNSFQLEDQFHCAICLEIFTDPVSTPCGHNFCKACLTKHWADKELYKCPLCNEKFNKGLKLATNIGFRDVVEDFKKQHAVVDNTPIEKNGQVACYYCPGQNTTAFKTCLVCLTSFCKTHLKPHHTVEVLKSHKLVNPVQNLEDKICKEHNHIVEFFCLDDHCRVCVLCTDHGNHNIVHLEAEYVDRTTQIGMKKDNFEENEKTYENNKLGKKNDGGAEIRRNVASSQTACPGCTFVLCQDPHHICGYLCIPTFTPNNKNRNLTPRRPKNKNHRNFPGNDIQAGSHFDPRNGNLSFIFVNHHCIENGGNVGWTQKLSRCFQNVVQIAHVLKYFLLALIILLAFVMYW